MAAGGADIICLSGAAVGAALAMLFSGRPTRQDNDLLQQQMLLQQQILHQMQLQQANFHPLPSLGHGSEPPPRHTQPSADHAVDSHGDLSLNVPAWEGFSMEDARKRNEQFKENFKDTTPEEVLSKLQRGNARFWTGCAVRPEKSAFERRALIMAQFPSSAVLGCSDSRVPTEVVFDQGLGDMFVVRVAGNCLETATKASLQYAVHHLKIKVLLVMGHEGCGAVKAAGLPLEQIELEPEALATTLKSMKAGLSESRLKNVHDSRAYDREAVVTNVRRQVEGLCDDEAIMEKVESKELIVVGCFYEISSGIVDFFMEVTQAPCGAKTPRVVNRGVSKGVQSRFEYCKDTDGLDSTLPSSVHPLPKGKSRCQLPEPDCAPVRENDEAEQANGPSRSKAISWGLGSGK